MQYKDKGIWERREFEELGHVWEFVSCQEREWEKGEYCAHLLSWYQSKFVLIDFNIEALVNGQLGAAKNQGNNQC